MSMDLRRGVWTRHTVCLCRTQVWDLGGQDQLRKVWTTYYVGSHGVVLVVDSMDRARMQAGARTAEGV